ncbi:MAG: tyrosine-type recombinase/integrase [Terrimicrobiaceae bacterium]
MAKLKTKQAREGHESSRLPDVVRLEALRALEILTPYGAGILDAAKFYVAHRERLSRSRTVSDAMPDFTASKKRRKLSDVHMDDLSNRMDRFALTFGNRQVSEITSQEIEDWIHSLTKTVKSEKGKLAQVPLAVASMNNFHGRIRSFFEHCVRRGFCDKNPFEMLEKLPQADEPPEILTPKELADLLNALHAGFPDMLPVVAIGAFAGLRTAEIERLTWEEINFTRGIINVSAAKAKSAKRRVVTMSDNLKLWLAPYTGRTGRVWPCEQISGWHQMFRKVWRDTLGWPRWKPNACRHSFASYHLAQHENAAKTALDMGHTGTALIFAAYREIIQDHADVAKYWNIKPPVVADNVIVLPTAAAA